MQRPISCPLLIASLAVVFVFAATPGCDDPQTDDDAGGERGHDAAPDDRGADREFFEEPAFATTSQTCPPADPQPRRWPGTSTGRRPAAHDRSRVVFAKGSSSSALRDVHLPPGASLAEVGQFYLERYAPRGLAAPARVASIHDRGGPVVVKVRQDIDGVPVFRKELNFILARDRALVAVSGELTASPVEVGAVASDAGADVDREAQRAIAAAARDLGVVMAPDQLVRVGERGPFVEFRPARGHAIATARARRTYFDDGRRLLLSFHVDLMGRFPAGPGPELRSAVVGPGGEVLFRNNKTHYAEPFAYRVYAGQASLEPAITPFCDQGVPHPTGAPDGFVPAEPCAQELVSLVHADIPTADPWLADDAVETNGNNVDAFFHIQTGDDFEFFDPAFSPERDFRAQVTGPREFDYPYDVARAPDDYFEDDLADPPLPPPDPADPQLNAKIAHGFYVGNYLHDLMYRHGYDEAAGNSQADNYGRGGLGGDPLLVHAGTLSTFTLVSADGVPPVLGMGLNGGTRLRRDGTLDLMIFAHEWMHTMQHRLIGDSEGLTTVQARALGEGWSDFLGLVVATRAAQAAAPANAEWSGVFGLGPYFNQSYCDNVPPPFGVECTDVDDVYYFGIRRYPFSVDMAKSPLTFRHIANGVELPEGIPQRFWKSRIENAELHSAGEIWASALWGSYRALLVDERYTFAEAKARVLGYLVASLKATPIDPTFLEARDALLAVVRASSEEDYLAFRQAFAARGMGAGAVAPRRDSNDLRGVIESMRGEGPALSFLSAGLDDGIEGDADGLLDRGESGTLTVRLRNTGFEDLSGTIVDVVPVGGHSDVTSSGELLSSAVGEDLVVEFPVRLREAVHHELVQFDVTFADAAADIAPVTVRAGFHVHYDVVHAERTDGVASPITQSDWFMDLFVPYQETVWARVSSGDEQVYELQGTRMTGGGSLVSPCILASEAEEVVLRFRQEYELDPLAFVELRTAGSPEFDWRSVYFLPFGRPDGEEIVEIDLREYAGQWFQIRFFAFVSGAADGGVSRWAVDDIEFTGIENEPFAVIVRQGEAP